MTAFILAQYHLSGRTWMYLVVQRNFDFISSPLNQLQYSPYINDTLYSYYIDRNLHTHRLL